MTKKIKWFAIQPLTGGMYLGAEEAIGNPAEAILSFKGLNEYKLHKLTGEPVSCGNERYLTNYLTSKNRMPNYYIFKDKTLQKAYEKQSWYKGTQSDMGKVEQSFNTYEKTNLSFLTNKAGQ